MTTHILEPKNSNTENEKLMSPILSLHFHRGCNSEISASLIEQLPFCDVDMFSILLFSEKAIFVGVGMGSVSVLSMEQTSNIVGLSSGFSWTHNRATCKHLDNLQEEEESSSN